MGLEKHVDNVIEEGNHLLSLCCTWDNGLKVNNALTAFDIMKILDGSGEFGPTRYNSDTKEIEFGVVKDFYKGYDYLKYCLRFKAGLISKEDW